MTTATGASSLRVPHAEALHSQRRYERDQPQIGSQRGVQLLLIRPGEVVVVATARLTLHARAAQTLQLLLQMLPQPPQPRLRYHSLKEVGVLKQEEA